MISQAQTQRLCLKPGHCHSHQLFPISTPVWLSHNMVRAGLGRLTEEENVYAGEDP